MNGLLINLTLFKAGWIAAVVSAAASFPTAGTLVIAVAAFVHIARAEDRQHEIRLLALAAVIGLLWESALVSTGLVQYGAQGVLPGIAPFWIVAMWVLFATTLNVGMRWLRKSAVVAALAGAIGGPLSFVAGEKAGAVTFPDASAALFAIGLGWAVFLPLLVRFAARKDEPAALAA